MSSVKLLTRPGHFRRTVAVTGHMTDAPDRGSPRFPESEVPRVRQRVTDVFAAWDLGSEDLLICGGARGTDLICAFEARRRGATVWVLLARAAEEFERGSVAGSDSIWIDQYYTLLQRVPSWELEQVERFHGCKDVYAAANEWILDTALCQGADGEVVVLAVWDGTRAAGEGGTGDMVDSARARDAPVEVINPRLGAVR